MATTPVWFSSLGMPGISVPPLSWPPLLAAASLLLSATLQRCVGEVGGGSRAVKAFDWVASHAIVAAWLLCGLMLSHDTETRLLIASFLVSVPRIPEWEITASLVLWVAHLAASGQVFTEGEECISRACWAPVLLFLLHRSENSVRRHREEKALTGTFGTMGSPRTEKISRPSFLDALSPTAAGPPPEQSPGRSPVKGTVGASIVRHFPNRTAPNPREIRSWTKAFSLQEELLAVYACTVPTRQGLSFRGNLFLSVGHICFQGMAIVTKGLQFAIALADVKEVRSGGSRDVARLELRRPLHLGSGRGVLKTVDLCGCEAGSAAIASMLARLDGGSKQEMEEEGEALEDERIDLEAPGLPATKRVSPRAQAINEFADGEPFRSLLEAHIPRLQLDALAKELLAPDWAPDSLMVELLLRIGGSEIKVEPWIKADDDDGSPASVPSLERPGPGLSPGSASPNENAAVVKVRKLRAMMALPPVPLCPRTSRIGATYCIWVTPKDKDTSIVIQWSTNSYDAPFGDRFVAQQRVELSSSEDRMGGVTFKLLGRCVFLESCGFLEGRIKSSSDLQVTKSGETMAALLQKRAHPGLPMVPKSSMERITCIVYIWELQRRYTIFSQVWRPPFLPHDGRKRWRWVDMSYKKHCWTQPACCEDAQVCDIPPVGPQEGWSPMGAWEISFGTGDRDNDGWQYAIDFYHDSTLWNQNLHVAHVRRRLWTRKFVGVEGQSRLPTRSQSSIGQVSMAAFCCTGSRSPTFGL
jgi:hypothetical protein